MGVIEAIIIVGVVVIIMCFFCGAFDNKEDDVSSTAAVQELDDKKVTFTVNCFSENATAEGFVQTFDGYSVLLKNEAITECILIEAETKEALKLVAEEVFQYWAKIEETGNRDFTNIDHKEHNEDLDMMFDVIGSKPLGNSAWSEAKKLKVGDKLLLINDTSNDRNPDAIKVLTESGVHIGYVEKDIQEKVGTFYQVGYAWVDEININGRIPRVVAVTYHNELFGPDHSKWSVEQC